MAKQLDTEPIIGVYLSGFDEHDGDGTSDVPQEDQSPTNGAPPNPLPQEEDRGHQTNPSASNPHRHHHHHHHRKLPHRDTPTVEEGLGGQKRTKEGRGDIWIEWRGYMDLR
ncbi:hypothetical protein PCANC_13647 [Puccinia coronata f. sp. avenae]|uniref:Uncharacterized protein n=1 Tax=Puccinia coronata f. sp. avenae TaxID=200324 RepID=A0A2N5UKX2_9BASI|nr:hypothetical protein PCANC_13647 [Puccinia coronata f. sp. avenae]